MRYSIEPKDRIYVKGYKFFAKNMGKNLSNKSGQKLLDNAKKSTTDEIKTASKRAIQKIAEATDNLIGNKIANKITRASKSLAKLHSKDSQNDDANNEIEVPKERSRSRGVYSTGSDIRFKTTMLKSSLCDYGDAYMFVKGTIRITGDPGPEPNPDAPRPAEQKLAARKADERNKGVLFKNCAPFTNFKSETYNTEIDNAKDIDIVLPMCNLIEYSNDFSKTSGSLWQYYKYEPHDNLEDSESFNSKVKITGSTPADGNTKKVEMIVPLKY